MTDPTLSEYLLLERAVSSIWILTHFKSNDTADVVPRVAHQDDTERHAVPCMAAQHSQSNDMTLNMVETSTRHSADDTKQHAVPCMAARHPQYNDMTLNMVETTTRHSAATPETLSRLWNVGLDTAQKTLRATTQHGMRSAVHPLT